MQQVLKQNLKEVFGYDSFRPLQEEAIIAAMQDRDCLLVLPTGAGKSICFQLPALLKKGLSIVVSPLIALMDDQVLALRSAGINAYALHSNLDQYEQEEIIRQLQDAEYTLIYMSPEKLLSPNILSFFESQKISMFAIDEAHCVSVWGSDFRPEYEKLNVLKEKFPAVPTIALTATADSSTRNDIIDKLKLSDPVKLVGSFERSNILTSSKPGSDRIKQITQFLDSRTDQAGIVYCLSRKDTEKVASRLTELGYKAVSYHAGMNAADRKSVHNRFIYDKVQIVCATIAFGMGIDKSNIRWVIHYNMPKNLEGYYQEIGRSGRDGEEAETLLFYNYGDVVKLRGFIDDSDSDENFKIVQYQKLYRMWDYANSSNCRTNTVLGYFGEYREAKCGHCDNCLHPPEQIDGKIIAQKALSAVYRSREKLTLLNLIDVLRGSDKADITRWGWHKIKTFGSGRDLSVEDWRAYITQLINMGFLSIDYMDYSKLKLTPLAQDVLFKEKGVSLAKFIWQEAQEKAKKISKKDTKSGISDADAPLYSKLKKLRKKIADEKNVPPYFIFSDASLRDMSHHKPISTESFLQIKGVGKFKLKEFGELFINEIQEELTSQ